MSTHPRVTFSFAQRLAQEAHGARQMAEFAEAAVALGCTVTPVHDGHILVPDAHTMHLLDMAWDCIVKGDYPWQ